MKNFLSKLDWSYFYALTGEATLALTLFFYIIIARVLGPEEYGVFAAAVALAAILSLFIQAGLPPLINREIAAHPETATRSISLFLGVETLTSLVVLLALWPLTFLLGYRGEVVLVCYLAVFAEVGRAMIMTLRSAIKGLGWFRAESIAVMIERVVVVGVSTILLFATHNLFIVMTSIVVFRAIHILGFFTFIQRQVDVFSKINKETIIATLKASYPFALSGVLWILYYQVDVVMLKSLSTEAETGLYSASYRIFEIFSALPRVIFYVMFTRFARYHIQAPEQIPVQIYKGARILVILVVPTLIIAGLIQTQLIQVLYGKQFSASLKSLSILLPSLAIKMFGTYTSEFLQATGREKQVPKALTIAASSNVVMNAVLIPQIASLGAAIATLLSECIMATSALWIMAGVGYPRASRNLGLLACGSLGLVAIPSLWLQGLPLGIAIAIGLPCIGLLLYRLRSQFFRDATAVS